MVDLRIENIKIFIFGHEGFGGPGRRLLGPAERVCGGDGGNRERCAR